MESKPRLVGPGRVYAPDERDRSYPVTDEIIAKMAERVKLVAGDRHAWKTGPVLDQGDDPACVGYGWSGFLSAAPVMTHHNRILPDPLELYFAAQKVDEWEGEDYDGTSVRAGAKVLQTLGLIKEYRWSTDRDQLREWLNTVGPAVIGIDWFNAMYRTRGGYIVPAGRLEGGHCVYIVDYSPSQRAYRIVNSWGVGWGEKGRAWVDEDDMEHLLFKMNGEVCHAIETLDVK